MGHVRYRDIASTLAFPLHHNGPKRLVGLVENMNDLLLHGADGALSMGVAYDIGAIAIINFPYPIVDSAKLTISEARAFRAMAMRTGTLDSLDVEENDDPVAPPKLITGRSRLGRPAHEFVSGAASN